jgi:hypothetical protein
MSKPIEKYNKEELIQEVYRLSGWSERLESVLEKIRAMTEKAGANEHARYCYELANELLSRKDAAVPRHIDLKDLFDAASKLYQEEQRRSGMVSPLPFAFVIDKSRGAILVYSEFGVPSRELADKLKIPWGGQ